MRLFAGIPIVDQARREIVTLLGGLRESGWPVRWVHEEGLHLTLKFYGEVASERLEVIEETVRFAADCAGPVSLRLDQLGAFPSAARPRVLYLGIEAPPGLGLLQDRLERGGEGIGFPPEGTPFHPHVTLGRVREGHRIPPHGLDDFAEAYTRVAFVGAQLVLYESILTTRGPRYEPRLSLELST